MKKLLLIFLTIFIFSCSNRTHETSQNSKFCLIVHYNEKVICMDAPIDTTSQYLFIQDNLINQKYKNLVVNYMMVVDIKVTSFSTIVILSNPEFSLKVNWYHSDLPKLEEMYYIISNKEYLNGSVLLESGILHIEEPIDESEYNEP